MVALDTDKVIILILIPYILFGIAYYSSHKGKPAWFTRKLIHTFGLAIVGLYGSTLNNLQEVFYVFFVFLGILVILSLIPNLRLFQSLIEKGTRTGEKKSESIINTTLTSISMLTLLVVSFDQRWLFFAGALAVAIGDGLGEFVGRPYGKHKYHIFSDKSIEGSLGVFFGTLVGILISFTYFDLDELSLIFFSAIILASLVATLIEAFSVSFVDNVLIPWGVAGVLFLLLN